jgi:GTP cyclohydrolase I
MSLARFTFLYQRRARIDGASGRECPALCCTCGEWTGCSQTYRRALNRRGAGILFEITEGYDGDQKLLKVFDTECRGEPDCQLGQVIEGPIPFYSLCEHHAFPFFGQAYVGYIPHEHIVGISKLTRLVRLFAKRFGCRSAWASRLSTPLRECSNHTGLRSIWRRTICVSPCAA